MSGRRTPSIWCRPGARDDEIIDVTGAGDSFCGSFCINLLRGRPLLEAAVCGMVGSAVSMGLRGVPEYLGVPFGRAEALYQRVRKQMANRIVRLGQWITERGPA